MPTSPQTTRLYCRLGRVPPGTTEPDIGTKVYSDSTLSRSMLNVMQALEDVRHRCIHQSCTLLDGMDHILELQLRA